MSRVVFVAPRPVWPARGGGQIRCAGLIAAAVSAGHQVLVIQPAGGAPPNSPAGLHVFQATLRHRLVGTPSKFFSAEPIRSPRLTRAAARAARLAVLEFEPDICVVSEVHSSTLLTLLPLALPLLYDSPNVESDLYRTLLDTAVGPVDRFTFALDVRRIARAERRLLAAADAVIAVSEGDLSRLGQIASLRRGTVVPSSVPTPAPTASWDADGPYMLFVGSLDYPPNIAALEDLVRCVLPAVRSRLPSSRLLVVGSKPSARLRGILSTAPGCDFREDVSDLSPYYGAARCMVLPIRSGSGTRLKVYECLAYGLPLVATDAAVSGIPLVSGLHFAHAESLDEFVRAVLRLLHGVEEAALLGSAGRELFERELSWEQVTPRFLDLLGAVIDEV